MAKSSTRKKSNKVKVSAEVAETIDILVNGVTTYLKRWTDRELALLQEQHRPICIKTGNGYRIGLYHLKVKPDGQYELYNPSEELVHVFVDKVSAVLYTIYTIKSYYSIANNILRLDQEINKHRTDIQTMRNFAVAAKKRKDYDSYDIRQSRIDIAENKLKFAIEGMQAIHVRAKAHKVWD